jgi:hypothetical protein
MDLDWRKVAVSLNGKGWECLELASKQDDPAKDHFFRLQGAILTALADALFEGLTEDKPQSD